MTTYRYVRGCLLALLLALTTSLAIETVQHGWQRSISSYYYTPAGPVVIAVLASVGVCLVALRGYTDAENVCLNLAGISAPMVGFVPTPERDHPPDRAAITNNAATFLTVLAVGYLVVLILVWRGRTHGRPVSWWSGFGLVAVAAAWLVGVVWLAADDASFAAHAHTLAAVFTFLPFVGVVVLNTDWGVRVIARQATRSRTRLDRAYWAVLFGMALVAAVFATFRSWDYALLGLETGILGLFAMFWILQTLDLRDSRRDAATTDSDRSALGDRP